MRGLTTTVATTLTVLVALCGLTAPAAGQDTGKANTKAKSKAAPKASAPSAQDLKRVYKREFAFLAAEKSQLTKRVATLDKEKSQKLGAAKVEIDRLQGGIMRSSLESERLTEMLYEAERSVEGIEESADTLDRTLEQVASELSKADIALPELPEDAGEEAVVKQLEFALDKAVGQLATLGEVRKEAGGFFDGRGERIDGTIVRVGGIASYGVSDKAAGALAPAGGGRLKIWPNNLESSAKTARALGGSGEGVGYLPIFLYESLDNGVDPKKDKTALEVVQSGGTIAWVIVGLGVLALLMILLRLLLISRLSANTDKLVRTIAPLVRAGQIDSAVSLCRKSQSSAGRVLRATLENLDRKREHLEDIISESILHETPNLDRFGSAILVLAAVAPLMGLLGTVTGMISTFDVITEFGTGNPKLLSGGISEALVTTELGLIVAIPSLLCGNLLSGWADGIKSDLDKSALRLTNLSNGIQVEDYRSGGAGAGHDAGATSAAEAAQA